VFSFFVVFFQVVCWGLCLSACYLLRPALFVLVCRVFFCVRSFSVLVVLRVHVGLASFPCPARPLGWSGAFPAVPPPGHSISRRSSLRQLITDTRHSTQKEQHKEERTKKHWIKTNPTATKRAKTGQKLRGVGRKKLVPPSGHLVVFADPVVMSVVWCVVTAWLLSSLLLRQQSFGPV